METKRCGKCGETKPVTEFYKNKSSKDGLHYWCKSCCKAYRQSEKGKASQARAEAKYWQSEKGKAVKAKYRQTDKGKAAMAKATTNFTTKIPPAVYKITCSRNGRAYIGSSTTPAPRRSRHWSDLKANRHGNPNLQADWNTHGKDAFTFEIIEDCSHLSEPELRRREQEYIDAGTSLYNVQDAVSR